MIFIYQLNDKFKLIFPRLYTKKETSVWWGEREIISGDGGAAYKVNPVDTSHKGQKYLNSKRTKYVWG